jgi:hypothetical protein
MSIFEWIMFAAGLVVGLISQHVYGVLLRKYESEKPEWAEWPKHRRMILFCHWATAPSAAVFGAAFYRAFFSTHTSFFELLIPTALASTLSYLWGVRRLKEKTLPAIDRRYRLRMFT